MRFLRWLAIAVLGMVVLLFLAGLVARLSDGPIGPFPGGPLVAGELVTDPNVDWSFARDIREIEFQLVQPPRSRTTWVVVHEGLLYIPCGFLDMPLWKQWPHEALEDGRTVLRIDGKRYERLVVRMSDPGSHAVISGLVAEKYGLGGGEPAGPDDLWIFRVDPRLAS